VLAKRIPASNLAAMPKPIKEKVPPKFYSIGEWFGADITSLSPEDRKLNAALAISRKVKQRPCPFRPGRQCNKAGGVCSVRQYQRGVDEAIKLGEVVTTCPARFFDGSEVFRWVGEVMLGTQLPRVIGEIPFLQKLRREVPEEGDEEPGGGDFIGRIDNILVHPDSTAGLNWCALEMQAVYFSGASMAWEFKDIEENPDQLRFPVRKRHPDFRSSGPKRLLPQLQTKVPELTTWGKKMAICVDESFFGELVGIEELKHLSNAHLAWFVVRYELEDGRYRLRPKRVVFSKLDSTVKALTGGIPLPKEVFEQQIRAKLGSGF
jgi:hypothetical protein